MNFIFEWSTRYRVDHEKIKFISISGHVIFCLLYKHQWNTKPFYFTQRRDLLCNHNDGDLFTCEDNMLSSRVKIWSFRGKAHLVFHWCLYNKRRNVFPKFIEICMEPPCWCPPRWAPTWRPETSRNICHWVLLQKRELSLEELKNVTIILYSNTRNVQLAEFPKISHLLNQHNSSRVRHVKATSRKSLEIQA